MKVEIRVAENFKKEAKPLLKKYPSLKSELASLQEDLLINPTLGTALGNHIYKIRLAIKSNGRGKSGGARIISFLEIDFYKEDPFDQQTVVNLISIYDKSELPNLSDAEIQRIIKNL